MHYLHFTQHHDSSILCHFLWIMCSYVFAEKLMLHSSITPFSLVPPQREFQDIDSLKTTPPETAWSFLFSVAWPVILPTIWKESSGLKDTKLTTSKIWLGFGEPLQKLGFPESMNREITSPMKKIKSISSLGGWKPRNE